MINYVKRNPTTTDTSRGVSYVKPGRVRYVIVNVPEGEPIRLGPGDSIVLGSRQIRRRIVD